MNTVSWQDLQRDPSSLLQRIEAGESLLLTNNGLTIAELRPVARSPVGQRPIGLAEGEFVVPADFDAPLSDEVLDAFEGR
ncbi:type II toxin-antitoxin system Phd/YefM family antitoxin [Anatilimnocola sp. NA78]|uniref:type II toxin-antitoxin system Phd/YefM family antitoxin n=1 Tax=Anatilimnocola sp. NA78 TaxID=3415683 RepID=UPI003CE47F2E